MNKLYEADILVWSEEQAALLRRLANGDRVDDRVDWENVIEEVESVGRSEQRAIESALIQALVHLLKTEAWPSARDRPHWQAEARRARDEAAAGITPSIANRIDLEKLYRRAVRALPDSNDGVQPVQSPAPECAFTLEELLAQD